MVSRSASSVLIADEWFKIDDPRARRNFQRSRIKNANQTIVLENWSQSLVIPTHLNLKCVLLVIGPWFLIADSSIVFTGDETIQQLGMVLPAE